MVYNNRFSFYRSTEWEKFRATFISDRLARDGELICDECKMPILRPYDGILHHKIELDEVNIYDPDIAFNPNNIMLVHHRCHDRIHERFGHPGTRHVFIVWGSPCAGKRAYVEGNAGAHDLIIDIDRLYEAMGMSRSNLIKGNVLTIYRTLIDQVRTRSGKWKNVWIVRTLPLTIDRELIVKDCLGGELIHIPTIESACLKEAERRGGDWKAWVEEYWTKFQPDPPQ